MPDKNIEFEKQHLQNLARQQKRVQELYYATIDEIFRLSIGISVAPTVFRITDYPALNAAITRILTAFQQQLYITLVNGIQNEWALSTAKNLALMEEQYGAISEPVRRSLQNPNQQAFTDFMMRQSGRKRLTLSDRVGNLHNQLQAEIEQTIYAGISEGQSAQKMAQEAKRFLREPDRLFRRVRNAKGKLVLSKPAKMYKAGQGVYRSSFKNALRLSATETNMAYRSADINRWQNTKFVLGYEVKLSRSHPAFDVCDHLKGVYPKEFIFTGWHPRCLCYSVPVLPSKEEYDKYEDALLAGKGDQFRFSGRVKDVPESFNQYVEDHAEQMEGWISKPNWIKENRKFVKQLL